MFYLPEDGPPIFPHPFAANKDGILAFGGVVNPDWLLLAYRFGIFPWFNEGEDILWWFLSPRLVLHPSKIKVAKSMRPYINQKKFSVSYDTCFDAVIRNCALKQRSGQAGTWINSEIYLAFTKLHEMGYAHSVEIWDGDELVGGLYGLAIGKIFFGESMFANKANASKFGFIHLAKYLERQGFELIDCQQDTPHLRSLGAELINKETFFAALKRNMLYPDKYSNWAF